MRRSPFRSPFTTSTGFISPPPSLPPSLPPPSKVPLAEKSKWASFFESYLALRPSLRVVFHLIDARHGPLAQDLATMEAMQTSLRPGESTPPPLPPSLRPCLMHGFVSIWFHVLTLQTYQQCPTHNCPQTLPPSLPPSLPPPLPQASST
jgi:hypothetical protein